MQGNETYLQRELRRRMKVLGKTARGLSLEAGLNESAVKNILSGKSVNPRSDTLGKIAAALGASVQDLTGEARESRSRDEPPDFLVVPEVDARAGMGGGGEATLVNGVDDDGNSITTEALRDHWGLPPSYIHSVLHVRPRNARIIEVVGDSMEPTLRAGDRVMVDIGDRVPSPPGVFALWDGFGVVVKRLEHIPNTDPPTVWIRSDNPLHESYERTVDEVNIVGRVVWYARQL